MRIFKSNSKMVMALSLLGVIVGSFVVSDVLDRVGLKEGMENEEKEGEEKEEEPTMEEEIDAAMEKVEEEEPMEEGMKNKKEGLECNKKEGMENKECNCEECKNKGLYCGPCDKCSGAIEPAAAPSSLGLFKF